MQKINCLYIVLIIFQFKFNHHKTQSYLYNNPYLYSNWQNPGTLKSLFAENFKLDHNHTQKQQLLINNLPEDPAFSTRVGHLKIQITLK